MRVSFSLVPVPQHLVPLSSVRLILPETPRHNVHPAAFYRQLAGGNLTTR